MNDVGLEFSEIRGKADSKRLDLLGDVLQEGDRIIGSEMLGAVDKLCIRSSDVADIGILGQIDVPEWEDDPKTINLTGTREIVTTT